MAEAGLYELNVKASKWGGVQYNSPIRVEIEQGVLLKRWFLILTIVLAPFALWVTVRRFHFEYRRWAPVTSSEDDD